MSTHNDDEPLHALVAERTRALTEMDIPALAAILHERYRYVDSLGRDLSRDAYLQSRAQGEVRIESQLIESLAIDHLGAGVAMVTLRTSEQFSYRGERFEARYQVVHICVRNERAWLFLFGQSTAIESAPGEAR